MQFTAAQRLYTTLWPWTISLKETPAEPRLASSHDENGTERRYYSQTGIPAYYQTPSDDAGGASRCPSV